MSFVIRRAVREEVPLFIGVTSGTGAGKTLSAIKMATGIAGRDRPFALVDTESGRARHYAPVPGQTPDFETTFLFDSIELDAPHSSDRYREAILLLKDYPCIVVDQASFEHSGEGGHLEQQQDELQARVKRARERDDKRPDWQLEEAYNRTSWIKPKHDRKKLISALIGVRVPVIFTFRAEEKMEIKEEKEGNRKKTIIIAAKDRPITERWVPICGKEFEPEMLAFFLLVREKRGVPIPLKLNEQHKDFVDLTKPLDEAAGRRFAQWVKGTAIPKTVATQMPESVRQGAGAQASGQPGASSTAQQSGQPVYITPDEALALEARCDENGVNVAALKKAAKVERLSMILATDKPKADAWIDTAIERRKQGAQQAA